MENNKLFLPHISSKKIYLIFIDYLILVFGLYLSFFIRSPEALNNQIIQIVIGIFPIFGIAIFYLIDLYKTFIKYFSFRSLQSLIIGLLTYNLIFTIFVSLNYQDSGIPRSVIFLNFLISFAFIGGSRIFIRGLMSIISSRRNANNSKKVLIYGAGAAGIEIASLIDSSPSFSLLGFVDDNPNLHGYSIRGVKVFTFKKFESLVIGKKIDTIFIAIPSLSKEEKINLLSRLQSYSIEVKILPSLNEIIGSDIRINHFREVNINDLLPRNINSSNEETVLKNVKGKNILITGAGGSIGSELSKKIKKLEPKKLVLFDISEASLYQIHKDLNCNFAFPILGSVTDKKRFEEVINSFDVDIIFHVAAYKHVPMVEKNIFEGLRNNIVGALNCANLASKAEVKNVVLISSDKAVRPTNIMGSSKRISELIFQSYPKNKSNFSIVRFGNVMGSSGSVIPLFTDQISSGGPVTITHKDMTRFFMTISEAANLIIQATFMSKSRDIYLLNMGNPVKILDLAKKLIKLSGKTIRNKNNPQGDIEIKYTGIRPGEKIYEELSISGEIFETDSPMIIRVKEPVIKWSQLNSRLEKLLKHIDERDFDKLLNVMNYLVPGYKYTKNNDLISGEFLNEVKHK